MRENGAIEAWHQWKSSVDIDHLDPGSQRLIPALYRNLLIRGASDPLMVKFKGVYRHTWYKNQILLDRMTSLLRSLHDAGIETLVLGGTALVMLHYKDYGARPVSGLHVCVRSEQASRAIHALKKIGWTPTRHLPEALVHFRSTAEFIDPHGQRFDLHWHPLSGWCRATSDADFWESAVLTEVGNVPTYALNPTDQLLHVCVHGVIPNVVPSFGWVADAMTVLNSSHAGIDWSRLITEAAEHRLTLPLRDTLEYLREALDASVPPASLQRIRTVPTSRVERIEYQLKIRPSTGLRGLLRHWLTFLRMGSVKGLRGKLFGFPRYLQHAWGMKHPWQVSTRLIPTRLRRLLKTARL